MSEEVINYFSSIETNRICAPTESGVINFDGNVKFNGSIDFCNNDIVYENKIDFNSDSDQNAKTGITIDFKPLENQHYFKMKIRFNNDAYYYQCRFYYNNKKIQIINATYIKYSIGLSIPEGIDDKLKLSIKKDKNIDIDSNEIYSMWVRISVEK
jgi:hypothetical protein